jgi:tape measure domain-containing protein
MAGLNRIMSKTISNLSVGLFGDVQHFANAFGKQAVGAVHSFASSLSGIAGKAAELTGIAAVLGGAFEGVKEIGGGFKLAAQFESVKVSMDALLGSADQAKNVLGDLRKFSVASPFEFGDLAQSARQLAAFGTAADQIAPTLNMLGNIAAGTGGSVNDLAELYIRVKENGILAGREIREFTTAGIPLTNALAKELGKTPEQIRQIAEAGDITFPMVQKAFIQMTGEGGAFSGMLARQAGTLGGLWHGLSHTIDESLERIAESIAGSFNLKSAIIGIADLGARAGDAVAVVVHRIAPALNAVVGGFESAYERVAQAVKAISNVVTEHFGMVLRAAEWMVGGSMGAAIIATWSNIYNGIAPVIQAIWQCVEGSWEGILSVTVNIGQAVIGAFSAISTALMNVANAAWNGIESVVSWAWTSITGKSTSAGQAVHQIWAGLGTAAKWLGNEVALAFRTMEYAITNWRDTLKLTGMEALLVYSEMVDRAAWAGQAVSYTAGFIGRNWRAMLTDMADFTGRVWVNINDNVAEGLGWMWHFMKGVNWSSVWNGFKTVVVDVVEGVAGFFVATFKALWNFVKNIDWKGAWKNFSGASSAALKETQAAFDSGEAGKFKWHGMAEGFKSSMTEAFKLPAFDDSASTKSLKKSTDNLKATYGKGIDALSTKQEESSKSAVKSLGEMFKQIFVAPIAPKFEMPKTLPLLDVKPVIPDSIKSMNLEVHPHIADHGQMIRWGSAEMFDLMQELQNDFGKVSRPAPIQHPFNNSRGKLVGGVMDRPAVDDRGPGSNNFYLNQIWQAQQNVKVATFG